jgi:phage protein D
MADANTSQLRVARPTVNVAGQDKPALTEGLLNLLIAENTSGLYRCEATFGNWGPANNAIDFLYFDRALLDFGKDFRVKIGDKALFEGRIIGLEADYPEARPPTLTVLAEDRFQDLRMVRRTRSFADVGDADVMRQIASDHGLSPAVDVQGPSHKLLAQVNQSDLAFLRERARAIDAEVWMDGTTLHAQGHAGRNGGTLRLSYNNELRSFGALADLSGQRTSVFATGWDVAGKTALRQEATDAAIAAELNGDTSGVSLLRSALGERKESLAHTVPLTSQEARSTAEAFFRLSARRFVTGRGVAQTDPRLRVGGYVDLQGLGPLFSGKYYLTGVQHLFDGAAGLRTEFTGERPGIGR